MGKEVGFVICLSVLTVSVAVAKVTELALCENVSQDICRVTELRVDPCNKKVCELKKGRNASMSFDFTPNFDATNMKTAVYWTRDKNETPFPPVGIANGCSYATCPVVSGTPNTLSYELPLGKKLPSGYYGFRWKLWNEENPKELCCFETTIRLK